MTRPHYTVCVAEGAYGFRFKAGGEPVQILSALQGMLCKDPIYGFIGGFSAQEMAEEMLSLPKRAQVDVALPKEREMELTLALRTAAKDLTGRIE